MSQREFNQPHKNQQLRNCSASFFPSSTLPIRGIQWHDFNDIRALHPLCWDVVKIVMTHDQSNKSVSKKKASKSNWTAY